MSQDMYQFPEINYYDGNVSFSFFNEFNERNIQEFNENSSVFTKQESNQEEMKKENKNAKRCRQYRDEQKNKRREMQNLIDELRIENEMLRNKEKYMRSLLEKLKKIYIENIVPNNGSNTLNEICLQLILDCI